jgi:AraC-like DNA-binding protein
MQIILSGGLSSELITIKKIKKNFFISSMDLTTKNPIEFFFKKEYSLIDFGFTLNGKLNNEFIHKKKPCTSIEITEGSGGIMFAPMAEGKVNIFPNQKVKLIHIHIEPNLLNSMLINNLDNTSKKFIKILEGRKNFFFDKGKISPEVKLCAKQLLKSDDYNLPGNIYREAKALELISLQLRWLYMNDTKPKTISFTPNDRKKIFQAKDLIEKSAEENINVSEISAAIGLGINKLNFGFKKIFGLSAAGFIKEFKMQSARQLLESGNYSVSEAAWNVGYTNVSHFSQAFKKKFDILPGSYLQSVKKNYSLLN